VKSATATRVAGREPEKIRTPINPFNQPAAVLSMFFTRCPDHALRIQQVAMDFPDTVQYDSIELYWFEKQDG
jgi:hypothetical protein